MKTYLIAVLAGLSSLVLAKTSATPHDAGRVPITITGGYETNPVDCGRPVVLIAAALKVPEDVFRKTFRNVKPALAGQAPEPDQVRKNKQALLDGLGLYGVTNDRLDEVSNYYRYRRSDGELWKHVEAKAYATVSNGKVTSIVITNPGAGYSSPPAVSIAGMDSVKLVATLSFGTELDKNGSIKEIAINNAP